MKTYDVEDLTGLDPEEDAEPGGPEEQAKILTDSQAEEFIIRGTKGVYWCNLIVSYYKKARRDGMDIQEAIDYALEKQIEIATKEIERKERKGEDASES